MVCATSFTYSLDGMQRDPVAFGIENHYPKPVGAERLFLLNDLAAVGRHRLGRFIEPAFH